MNEVPANQSPIGNGNAQMFFPAEAAPKQSVVDTRAADLSSRNTCRWCLEKFDPTLQQPRSIRERGQLRTRLMMADDGSEPPICDSCWSGANGHAVFLMGQVVPCSDPDVITNPLLRR